MTFADLLACPLCEGELRCDWSCARCGRRYDAADGIPNLRLPGDTRVEIVRRFYERTPFPGYPPRDTLAWLRARAERSDFARQLDRAIAGDARIAEIGCGTGQMSLYLARGDRVVVGADLTRESLRIAADAARRFAIDRVLFVETDLLTPGSGRARSMSCTPRASFITRRTRARRLRDWCGWSDPAAQW